MKRWITCWGVWACTWLGGMSAVADQRGQLWTEHSDIRVIYDPSLRDPLFLGVRDEDHRILYAPTNVVLNVADSSRIALPSGTPFGAPGEDMWILPQSQDPNLLYLGFSAEGLPRDVFSAPLRFRLVSVNGPGGFAAWQAGAFGRLNVKFNSMDGIDDRDQTSPIIGSHEHFNWGFKAPGVYAVTFVVEGDLLDGQKRISPPATLVFHVHPLPSLGSYADFAARTWHPDLLEGPGAPGADPDGDGLDNEWEFYVGSDPALPDAVPVLTWKQGQQPGFLRLEYAQRDGLAEGVGLVLQKSPRLEGPWEIMEGAQEVAREQGVQRWALELELKSGMPAEFFRVWPAHPLTRGVRGE